MPASRNVYEYVVLQHNEPQRDAQGNDVTPNSKIIVEATTVIAKDEAHARNLALAEALSEGDVDLKNVEVKIKGF